MCVCPSSCVWAFARGEVLKSRGEGCGGAGCARSTRLYRRCWSRYSHGAGGETFRDQTRVLCPAVARALCLRAWSPGQLLVCYSVLTVCPCLRDKNIYYNKSVTFPWHFGILGAAFWSSFMLLPGQKKTPKVLFVWLAVPRHRSREEREVNLVEVVYLMRLVRS